MKNWFAQNTILKKSIEDFDTTSKQIYDLEMQLEACVANLSMLKDRRFRLSVFIDTAKEKEKQKQAIDKENERNRTQS